MAPYQYTNNLIDISDPDTPVYRIFPLERFLQLLRDRELALVRPRLWDDPFENFLLNCEVTDDKGRPIGLDLLRDKWYGQCWSLKEETDAMWRIYSPHVTGIRVQSTVRKVLDPLVTSAPPPFEDLAAFAGRVTYSDPSEIRRAFTERSITSILTSGREAIARTLLIKRDAFSHEEEIRFLFQDVDNKHIARNFYSFHIDPDDLIKAVVLDPRLESSAFQCLKLGIEAVGCKAPVDQSQLYTVERLKMRLD